MLIHTQCSRDDVGSKMRKKIEDIPAVHIGNPKTQEFQVCMYTVCFLLCGTTV